MSIDEKLKGTYSSNCACSSEGYTGHSHASYAHMSANYSGDYKSGRKRTCC